MDLAAIQAALAGLGPWGIAAGIGLTLAVQWLRNRNNPAPAPAPSPSPDPAPSPVPAPAPAPSGRPILDAILAILPKLLDSLLAKKTPSVFSALPAANDPDLSLDDAQKILKAMQDALK